MARSGCGGVSGVQERILRETLHAIPQQSSFKKEGFETRSQMHTLASASALVLTQP